ncbi:hypothetical protein EON65_37035 [archaeon]|nr:MAG: hypothetical protein EON65_37035 [archaeon]
MWLNSVVRFPVITSTVPTLSHGCKLRLSTCLLVTFSDGALFNAFITRIAGSTSYNAVSHLTLKIQDSVESTLLARCLQLFPGLHELTIDLYPSNNDQSHQVLLDSCALLNSIPSLRIIVPSAFARILSH